jgi:hypothetical protein
MLGRHIHVLCTELLYPTVTAGVEPSPVKLKTYLPLQHVAEPNLIGQSAISLKVIWHGQHQDN